MGVWYSLSIKNLAHYSISLNLSLIHLSENHYYLKILISYIYISSDDLLTADF